MQKDQLTRQGRVAFEKTKKRVNTPLSGGDGKEGDTPTNTTIMRTQEIKE